MIGPWIIRLLASLLLLNLIACTNKPTVHLYKRYISAAKAQALVADLEQKGIRVTTNEFTFPKSISKTTILSSPLLQQPELIEQTQTSLQTLGFEPATTSSLVIANHWYTKNSLGLFIMPEGANTYNQAQPVHLAQTYTADKCDTNIKLTLEPNGDFHYFIEQRSTLTGKWSVTAYPYLLLQNQQRHFTYYYQLSSSQTIDQISEVDLTELTPLSRSNIIPACQLVFGQRH